MPEPGPTPGEDEPGREYRWPGYRYCCAMCSESIRSRAEAQQHRERHRQERLFRMPEILMQHGILEEHANAKLGDFPKQTPGLKRVQEWREPGALILGSVGTGKTRLLAALCREYLVDGRRVVYSLAGALLRRIRESYRDVARESEADVVEDLVGADLLAIDDLAHEGKITDHAIGRLHEVLSIRHGSRKYTAITTNLSLREIGELYDQSIASRLSAWRRVVMTGTDRRKP